MAAAVKALNAKIRSNKYTDYLCSTRTLALETARRVWDLAELSIVPCWRHQQRCVARLRFAIVELQRDGFTLGRFIIAGRMANLPCANVDFWGPASNFGIPIAAVMDTQKDPEMYENELPIHIHIHIPLRETATRASSISSHHPFRPLTALSPSAKA